MHTCTASFLSLLTESKGQRGKPWKLCAFLGAQVTRARMGLQQRKVAKKIFFVIVNGNGAIFSLNEHQIVLCAAHPRSSKLGALSRRASRPLPQQGLQCESSLATRDSLSAENAPTPYQNTRNGDISLSGQLIGQNTFGSFRLKTPHHISSQQNGDRKWARDETTLGRGVL